MLVPEWAPEPLDDFLGGPIRDCWHPQRPGVRLAITIRDIDPPNRWCHVAPRGLSIPELVRSRSQNSLRNRVYGHPILLCRTEMRG
jgi:hypothetical protein